MRLKVHVRELELSIPVGNGAQTFRWLGSVVVRRYAAEHGANVRSEMLKCIHIVSAESKILFPAEAIRSHCRDGDKIFCELLGCSARDDEGGVRVLADGSSPLREKSLWELYAYASPLDYASVLFELTDEELGMTAHDGDSGGQVKALPGLFGNFNNWGVPVEMAPFADPDRSGRTIYRRELAFPVGAQIVFKFVHGSQHILSSAGRYHIVCDPFGAQLNYLKVVAVPREYRALQGLSAEVLAPADSQFIADTAASTSDTPLPPAVKEPRFHVVVAENSEKEVADGGGVARMELSSPLHSHESGTTLALTSAMKDRLFESDWYGVHLDDICDEENARDLCARVRAHTGLLSMLFLQHASHHVRNTAFMSSLAWLKFCQACKIIDGQSFSGTRVDRIFHQIATPEPRGELQELDRSVNEGHSGKGGNNERGGAADAATAQTYFAALRLGVDPFDNDNQFLRSQFYEAICRVAILRHRRNKTPADAFETVVQDLLEPYAAALKKGAAGGEHNKSMHMRMLHPRVQAALEAANPDLMRLFESYATSSRGVGGNAISMAECASMLYDFDLLDDATCSIAAAVFGSDAHTMFQQCVLGDKAMEVQQQQLQGVSDSVQQASNNTGAALALTTSISYAEFLDLWVRIAVVRSEKAKHVSGEASGGRVGGDMGGEIDGGVDLEIGDILGGDHGSTAVDDRNVGGSLGVRLKLFLDYVFPRDGNSRVQQIMLAREAAAAAKAAADALARKKRIRARRLRIKKERLRQKMIARGELPPDEEVDDKSKGTTSRKTK